MYVAHLVILALTLLAFSEVRSLDFINLYDDKLYLTENPVVREGFTLVGVRWAFTSLGYASNWHPLTWLSHMLDVQLFGLAPVGHHLANLLIHLLNSELLLMVLIMLTGSLWPSVFVTALFAVHPLHVQSVAWVAERKDVLSSLFWMLTLWSYLRYVQRPGGRRYALVVVAFGLGLLAKPMLVTLPFVLLLLDFWPLGRLVGRRINPSNRAIVQVTREKLPLFLLAAASCVITILAQSRAISAALVLPMDARISNALLAYVGYLGKMIWPLQLSIFYPQSNEINWAKALVASLWLLLFTLTAFFSRRSHPAIAVGWLWYLGTLVPVIGLIQVGGQTMADRYTYLPLIGIFIAIAFGLSDLLPKWKQRHVVLVGSAALALAALLPVTMTEVRYWKDSLTIFGRALEVTSRNWVAERSYGTALLNLGRAEEALPHLIESARISAGSAEASHNLGVAYYRLNQKTEAAVAFRQATRLDQTYAPAHYNLGVIAAESGDLAEGIEQFRETLKYQPESFEAQFNLGLALERSGARKEALAHFREALRIRPADRDALAGVQRNLGR